MMIGRSIYCTLTSVQEKNLASNQIYAGQRIYVSYYLEPDPADTPTASPAPPSEPPTSEPQPTATPVPPTPVLGTPSVTRNP